MEELRSLEAVSFNPHCGFIFEPLVGVVFGMVVFNWPRSGEDVREGSEGSSQIDWDGSVSNMLDIWRFD
ncbi:hypothetical protein WICPIJ_007518 [Wickerhamomyces pijperi]|uniref:Uncharacterized protein n=1 Tax=Wickerhamomyces pijperi TaxID=599730 RepID=A0A9P8Q1Q2_WICPI|nr:hypothetical protein WICPIJ_007518 [Wickerhamomyces pijperi]